MTQCANPCQQRNDFRNTLEWPRHNPDLNLVLKCMELINEGCAQELTSQFNRSGAFL